MSCIIAVAVSMTEAVDKNGDSHTCITCEVPAVINTGHVHFGEAGGTGEPLTRQLSSSE